MNAVTLVTTTLNVASNSNIANLVTPTLTSNATNLIFNFDTMSVPYIYSTTINNSSVGNFSSIDCTTVSNIGSNVNTSTLNLSGLLISGATGSAGQVLQATGTAAGVQWASGAGASWTATGIQSNIYYSPGNVAIGTSTFTGGYTLQVSGNVGVSGDLTTFYSDDRLKTRVGNITEALDKIRSLDCFYYENNELAVSYGFEKEGRRVGLSAQQVQKVLPEAVKPAPFNSDYLTIQYDKLVPLLVQAVKELSDIIRNGPT
jgi:hypothetical protein